MKKETKQANPKVGAGVKPQGVFARIAADDKARGVADGRVRHTTQANVKK